MAPTNEHVDKILGTPCQDDPLEDRHTQVHKCLFVRVSAADQDGQQLHNPGVIHELAVLLVTGRVEGGGGGGGLVVVWLVEPGNVCGEVQLHPTPILSLSLTAPREDEGHARSK